MTATDQTTCAACDRTIDADQAWHSVEGLGEVHTSQQGCAEARHREEATRPTTFEEPPA